MERRDSAPPVYVTPRWFASHVTPRNMAPSISTIEIMVLPAFFAVGSRKADTPLEMASTPVSAVQPAA